MTASTFPRAAVLVVLILGGCATTEAPIISASPDSAGWLLTSGKEPTKAEFAALAATCESKGGAVDACLTDLGLKRTK
jgi:hypothetical protein